jgi:pyroglutamyl-peptidase
MTLLLTSFTTWLTHQKSNSADDLLEIIERANIDNCCYLRQLPVEIKAASQKAIAIIEQIQPSAIICCGMAESRERLSIESNARCRDSCLYTAVNLPQLVSCLSNTSISHDAGQFVCEGLYYQVLDYLRSAHLDIPCLFVHVPVLTTNNKAVILQDFETILNFFTTNK